MRSIAVAGVVVLVAAAVGGWFALGPGAAPPTAACELPRGAEPKDDEATAPELDSVRWLGTTVVTPVDDFDEEQILDVAAFRNGFVAVGRASNGPDIDAFVLTSADGQTWNRSAALPGFLRTELGELVVANGRLFALGSTSTNDRGGSRAVVWTSGDGRQWSEARGRFDERIVTALAGDGDELLLLGHDPVRRIPISWRSSDGRTWEESPIMTPMPPEHSSFADLAWTGEGWLAVGAASRGPDAASAAIAWTSRDGETWMCSVLPGASNWRTGARSLVDDGGSASDVLFVVGDGSRGCGIGASCPGFQVTWASRGTGWTDGDAPGAAFDAVGDGPQLWSATYATSGDVLVAAAGRMWISDDGSAWAAVAEEGERPAGEVQAVAIHGDRIVVAGALTVDGDVDAWIAVGDLWP